MIVVINGVFIFIIIMVVLIGHKLTLRRDFFFLFFLLQSLIYTLVMPTVISFINNNQGLTSDYIRYQFYVFFLFIIPLILVYKIIIKTKIPNRVKYQEYIDFRRTQIFSNIFIFFSLIYFLILVKTGMVFSHIGTYEAAARIANLGMLNLFIIRSYQFVSLPLISYLLYLLLISRHQNLCSAQTRRLLKSLFFVALTANLVVGFLSSRTSIIVTGVVLLGVYIMTIQFKPKFNKKMIKLTLISLLVVYCMITVWNIRFFRGSGDPMYSIFNPCYAVSTQSIDLVQNEWIYRFDGLDLIRQIEPGVSNYGLANGKAWRIPAFIAFHQFLPNNAVHEYKATARTTAKSYLMSNYSSLDPGDHVSCMLTDLYGNFGFFGFFPGAIFCAFLFGIATKMFFTGNDKKILLSLIIILYALVFEQEFITLLVGWVRMLPILIVLIILNPSKKLKP